jgi:DNA helicase TIP49 (TBP-interacting protein)
MPKAKLLSAALRRQERLRLAELPNVVEGQITEICRDLAVHVKRMRQLQEQADELRVVIREWVSPANREGRR